MTPASHLLRVLLVDDDPMLRLLASEALDGGFEIFEAERGSDAIAMFEAVRPDIVVLDVMMPDVDGFEVCRAIRATTAGASTPILMMTGLDDDESIHRAYEVGATDFVTKPIAYALLAHRLRYLHRAAAAIGAARQNVDRLARAQRLARLVQWELDLTTRRFRWSEEAAVVFGIPRASATVDGALLRWVHESDRDLVAHALRAARPHRFEYRMVLPDGRTRIVHQEADVVVDPIDGQTRLEGSTQDITDLRDAEQQVHDLAFFDPLTRLPNRAFLRRFLGHALPDAEGSGSQIAVLALDLDGFKRVNDTLGHAGGDELLREVARRLASCIPPPPASEDGPRAAPFAARLGGDEFVVVLPGIGCPEDATGVATRIADRIASSHQVGEAGVFVSSSIGIAIYPADGTNTDALLDRADVAMYHAKQGGRNRFSFYRPSMHEVLRARVDVETRLRTALERSSILPSPGSPSAEGGGSQFRVEYQPKVLIPHGTIVGFEALVRWDCPHRGAVSPADFIPVAEETGLIVPLGTWVLRTACRQASAWQAERGTGHRVAVNVSARQFHEPGFARLVAEVLRETDLDPGLLEIEITEGMLMEDTTASKDVLEQLKALGVRIALDDFGTGYSSLSYLARLPIDALKIDRSFIRDLGSGGRGETITAAIIALSQSLGIDVVVEGVEEAEQLAFVGRHGTAEVQGFFFARPMSPTALEVWRLAYEARRTKRPVAA